MSYVRVGAPVAETRPTSVDAKLRQYYLVHLTPEMRCNFWGGLNVIYSHQYSCCRCCVYCKVLLCFYFSVFCLYMIFHFYMTDSTIASTGNEGFDYLIGSIY